jgi:hypothetical protein
MHEPTVGTEPGEAHAGVGSVKRAQADLPVVLIVRRD